MSSFITVLKSVAFLGRVKSLLQNFSFFCKPQTYIYASFGTSQMYKISRRESFLGIFLSGKYGKTPYWMNAFLKISIFSILVIIIFRPYILHGRKFIYLKRWVFFYVYLSIVRAEGPDSEFEFFDHKVSKYAVGFDRIRKIFQIRTQFGFLEKNKCFFLKKLDFFKIGRGGKFVVECVSYDIISWNYLFRLNFLAANLWK